MRLSFIALLKAWFRLSRWNNLIIIALTMILVRYALIQPLLGKEVSQYPLSHFSFFLLVLSIVFAAAGGYIINDYFDVKIDRINHPDHMVLGRYIGFKQAVSAHQVFSAIAIILGFYTGYKAGSLRIGGIQAVMVAVLWFYSYRYKGLFIWGNLVVALLSGMSIIIVWLFEFYSLQTDALAFGGAIAGFKTVNKFIISYFIFSVLITLAREIVKDVADIPGDSKYNCHTLAVKLGEKRALGISAIMLSLTLVLLIILQGFYLNFISKPLLIYTVILLDIPLCWIIYKTFVAHKTTDFQRISLQLKYLMLAGIISMVFITL